MRRRIAFWIPLTVLLVAAVAAGGRGGERTRPRPARASRATEPLPAPPPAATLAIVPVVEVAPAAPRLRGPIENRVAAIAASLSLEDRQCDGLRKLLENYAARFDLLLRTTDWTIGDSRARFAFAQRRLQLEFDQQVTSLLTPEQADAYARLPELDRSADLGVEYKELSEAPRSARAGR